MIGFLIDTCVVSEFRKPVPNAGLQLWLSKVDHAALHLSAITIGELRYGIDSLDDARKKAELERWLVTDVLIDFAGRVLPLDDRAAAEWGTLRAKAAKAGSPLPVVDAMIAAIARRHGLSLVTRNERDFRTTGIPIINPWET